MLSITGGVQLSACQQTFHYNKFFLLVRLISVILFRRFMLGRWIFHPLFCSVVIVMQHVSVVVSVYTLTAIGVDR
jgi:hypothetical protein